MNQTARQKPFEAAGAADSPEALPFRTAPHNLEAEQALLGAILVNNEAHDRVSSFLEAHHFFDPLHQQIYETASKLIAAGKRATPITLRTYFEAAEPINASLTVPQYLGQLAADAVTIINARDYGRTIHDLAIRRGLIIVCEDSVNTAYDSPVNFAPKAQIEELLTRSDALLRQYHERNERSELSIASSMSIAIESINDAYKRSDGMIGLSTGFPGLDALTGGLNAPDLLILAAATSMGKSTLMLNIATHVGRNRVPVLIFSLEMSAAQLAMRLLAEETGRSANELRRGRINTDDMRALIAAEQRYSEVPIYIDQSGGLTIAQITSIARRLDRKRRLGLVVVDYLQLAGGSVHTGGNRNRTQEVTEVTRGLKSLAKELDVPVLALCQLNRDVDKRQGHRPQLSDLRESGSIEQDADVVMFIHRGDYYLEREKPCDGVEYDKWVKDRAAAEGRAEVIVAKQRQGALGSLKLMLDKRTLRFIDDNSEAGILE